MATLATMVAEARESAGLTQLELAKRIGVSQTTIHFIEKGDTTDPSTKVREGLARVLGLSLYDIAVATGHVAPATEFDTAAELRRIGAIADDQEAAREADQLPPDLRRDIERIVRARVRRLLDTINE